MISSLMRQYLFVLSALYECWVVGCTSFPAWSSENFAWRKPPMVAMTMGGWCLGTAFAGYTIARRQCWTAMLCAIIYVALFGVFETAVIVAFWARVVVNKPLALLYLVAIFAAGLFALVVLAELRRQRPLYAVVGRPFGGLTTVLAVIFILLVAFLGSYGLLAQPRWRALNAGVFSPVTRWEAPLWRGLPDSASRSTATPGGEALPVTVRVADQPLWVLAPAGTL